MDTIVVGFSRPSGWFEPFSWLIRLAYWSSFSHTYIKYNVKELNINLIIQASGLTVNLISENVFDPRENIYKEFTLPIEIKNKKALIQFGLNQLGKPYNIFGIFGMAWVRLGQVIGRKWNNPISYNGSSDFCSELVGYLLENFENINAGNVANLAPVDVYKIISQLKVNAQSISQP
jgi:hypothetical protein